jgi:hypothetical protein
MFIVRVLATIISGPMLLMGILWILQGFNVPNVPSSFMTANMQWAAYGAGLALVGGFLVLWVNRRS